MTVLSYVSILALSLALSGAMNAARADTIILKNGRRITVNVAKETADRVTGETDAGEISLPKSMVERIEHGPVGIPTSANRRLGRLIAVLEATSANESFERTSRWRRTCDAICVR